MPAATGEGNDGSEGGIGKISARLALKDLQIGTGPSALAVGMLLRD